MSRDPAQVRGSRGLIGRGGGGGVPALARARAPIQLQPGLKRKAALRQLSVVEVSEGERVLRRDKFSINGRAAGLTEPLLNTQTSPPPPPPPTTPPPTLFNTVTIGNFV